MKFSFSVVALVASLAHGADVPLGTSHSPKAQTQCESLTPNGEFYIDPSCDSLLLPNAWQKPIEKEDGEPDFDLIVIGGGVGGAYMVNMIRQQFTNKGQPEPKIGLFERTPQIGGRLVSAWGAGGLGEAVSPIAANETLARLPLQEYGGMRINPYTYPLIWDKVVEFGKAIFGDENCLTIEEVYQKPQDQWGENWCPDMFVRMNVGDIRYATHNPDLGILTQSTVNTTTTRDYCLDAIADGRGSPYTNCVQLGVAASIFETMNPKMNLGPNPFNQGMGTVCGTECSQIDGLCDLCAKFPDPAAAIISCSGYDQPASFPFDFIIGLLKEAVSYDSTSHLNLVRGGYQRLSQMLLNVGGLGQTSPQFYRTLTSLSLENGDVATLAKEQIAKTDGEPEYEVVPTSQIVTAKFQDGSEVTAKAVYMTMLPGDMPMVEGLEAWEESLAGAMDEGTASKLVLGWNDASKAPAALLNASSCVQNPCQRLILDGVHSDGWMIRQWWLWDDSTIMVYDVGAPNTPNFTYPATTMIEKYSGEGMGALVEEIMHQFRNVTGLTGIADPDWGRYKPWPRGSLMFWQDSLKNTTNYAGAVSSPLGADIPVWYGNSEASGNANLHGWAEGALDMAYFNLQSMATYLGLEGDVTPRPVVPADTASGAEMVNALSTTCDDSSSDATPVDESADAASVEKSGLRRSGLGGRA